MNSKIFTLASAKGGSGKTLLTASFAAFLSELGKKVLIIDTDASTNGLTLMYLKEVSIQKEIHISNGVNPRGIFDSNERINTVNKVKKDRLFDTVILKNGVYLIPATFNFQYKNEHLPEVYLENITHILDVFRDDFDFIFIDSQAGSDEYAAISLRKNISDEVIVVSEYDPLSAAGVERLKGIFRDDLTYNRTWYLLNKMIPEFIQSFSDFLEIAKYLNPIPWDADVVRAYARRRLPLDLENGNEFTLAIIQTLRTLLGEQIATEIDKWKATKEDFFKKPIEEEYNKLLKKYKEVDKIERNKRFVYSLFLAVLVSLTLVLVTLRTYFRRNDLDKEDISFYIFLGLAGIIITLILTKFLGYFGGQKIGESLEREILREKIKKIETLRMSSFDALIRNKKNK